MDEIMVGSHWVCSELGHFNRSLSLHWKHNFI